jgi:pimeloyl-ACP methyl ester carboxylesterase
VPTVTSADGTTIAFDRAGDGPLVILINAGPTDRTVNAPFVDLLAPRFTVLNYDRRGRGQSGDTQPYAVDREYEDLVAVIDAGGGSAMLYGSSGGAALALEAAARGLPVTKLALWEPPYYLDDEPRRPPADYHDQLAAAVAARRPDQAVALFFTAAVGMPGQFVDQLRQSPYWPAMQQLAQALIYDAQVMGDFRVPADRLGKISLPTLVIDGGTTPSISRAAAEVARLVPGARRRTLPGQPHNVDAAALAPALVEFFGNGGVS